MNWIFALGAPLGYLFIPPMLPLEVGSISVALLLYLSVVALFYAFDALVMWGRKKIHGSN